MKRLLTTLFLAVPFFAFSQQAVFSNIEINKVVQPCVKADYDFSESIITKAFENQIEKLDLGKSSKEKGGFRVYKEKLITQFSQEKMDLYYRIDGRKDKSSVYMLASKGYDNFMNPEAQPDQMLAIKNFMDGLVLEAKKVSAQEEIESQEKTTSKAASKYEDELKEAKSLAEDKKNIEEKMAQNVKDQEKDKATWESEKAKLAELKKKLAELK
ncbi:MAG: hypothetical protein KA275_05495 [Chitinophagaceae bacterium]|nr:hypothetical protein [Chitinophagaceae bacterium]